MCFGYPDIQYVGYQASVPAFWGLYRDLFLLYIGDLKYGSQKLAGLLIGALHPASL